VEDVIVRRPQLDSRAAYLRKAMRDRLIEHKNYIRQYGEDIPDVRDWKWAKDPTVGGTVARPADAAGDDA
jgi:xylulose-5-phosphate/fructose-6-phosphate phosphoketolase